MYLQPFAAFAACWLCFMPAHASDESSLRFEQTAQKTLAARPEFARFALSLAAFDAKRVQAALKPAFELDLNLENALGTGASAGLKEAELTLSIGSIFEKGNKRMARVEWVDAAQAQLRVEQKIAALDLLAETGRRFVALAIAQESLRFALAAQVQALKTLAAIKPRVAIAQSPKTEQLNSEITLADANLAADNAELALHLARTQLGALWQADTQESAQLSVALGLYDLPESSDSATLDRQLEMLPDLNRFASQQRVAQAEIALAKSQATSDWRWSVGVRRLEAANDQAFVGSLSIPLGSAKRSTSLVQEAQINAQLAPLDAKVERQRLQALRAAQLVELASARLEARAVMTEQLPQAREVLALTRYGWEIGRYSYRDLAAAQAQLLALERRRLLAAERYHLTRIELERLTGAALPLLELAP